MALPGQAERRLRQPEAEAVPDEAAVPLPLERLEQAEPGAEAAVRQAFQPQAARWSVWQALAVQQPVQAMQREPRASRPEAQLPAGTEPAPQTASASRT